MKGMDSAFKYGIWDGTCVALMLGVAGAVIAGGVAAIFGGPIALTAAISAGIFGALGAAGSAVGAETSGTGNARSSMVFWMRESIYSDPFKP